MWRWLQGTSEKSQQVGQLTAEVERDQMLRNDWMGEFNLLILCRVNSPLIKHTWASPHPCPNKMSVQSNDLISSWTMPKTLQYQMLFMLRILKKNQKQLNMKSSPGIRYSTGHQTLHNSHYFFWKYPAPPKRGHQPEIPHKKQAG